MTNEKILSVLKKYEDFFNQFRMTGLLPLHDEHMDGDLGPVYQHLLTMIPQMRKFIEEGRRDKVFRWLGFMQGAMWALGSFTLDELKDDNRPTDG